MLYLKKYFTEGLIQMAILLSLCGVRVDVGLEPYLPPSWHEMITGPTAALTQTQFHNLRNRLEDGPDLHPKSVDLDGFFTARRLLGWVHSLDRLQVPHAEVETWLVQQEPCPLPMVCPDQSSPLERAPARVERDRTAPPQESSAGLGTLQEEEEEEDKEEETHHAFHDSSALEEREEEEHRGRRTEGRGRPGGSHSRANNGELTPNEGDQLRDVGCRRGDLEPPGREPHIIPTGNPSFDLELHWQDLLAIMEPEDTDVDMMTSFDTQDSREPGTLQGAGSEACNFPDDSVTDADQQVLSMEAPLQHGLLGPPRRSEVEPALLPLTPSADLNDHSSALNTRDALKNCNVNPSHPFKDHTHLLAKDPSEDFCVGLNREDYSDTFNLNLLTQGLLDTMEDSPSLQYATNPENHPRFDTSFHSPDLTPSSFTSSSPEGNGMTRDLLTSPSSFFLVDEEEDVDDEGGLPSSLGDLFEDTVIPDEMRLLDLALEEGFSPEMAAKLEEEGFLDREIAQQETRKSDQCSGSGIGVTEDQDQHQDGEDQADSDSGLSLDFSRSPASPCASETSSYSSSSASSSSCASAVASPFSEDEDEEAEQGFVGSLMDVEMTIKQERLEEEEMGAVGGGDPYEFEKPFPFSYGHHKLYPGFPRLQHIGHDHTYNQPSSPTSSSSMGLMPTKHTKSSSRNDNAKPYHRSSSRHISESKMWSRDERRARSRKIPFSNELIVNLPVEEFNNLMSNYQLSQDQLTLIRDIRRRGKNKIAAQNCRKRKLDVVVDLKDSVSGLRRYRSQLLREKQEALRNLQEMKRRLGTLYQDIFSTLRDEDGMPLNAMEYMLHIESDGSVMVASRQQSAAVPRTKTSKKQRDKKK